MAKEETKKVESNSRCVDDALRDCNVDQSIWEVDHFTIGENTRGYNFTLYLKKRGVELADMTSFFAKLGKASKSIPLISRPTITGEKLLAEVNISDLHLGSLCWEKETGNNYDLKIAEKIFREAINHKVKELKRFPIEKIIFPLGNDFYHFDNFENTTTGGTPQDSDSRFPKMFQKGVELIIWAINQLKKIAPVEIIVVSGNHGRTAEQALGCVISAYFHNDKNVTVDDSLLPRKYRRYGKTLLGYLHGDSVKMDKLPLLMATEAKKWWGETKYRYITLGHFHHQSKTQDEISGVLVSISGALCSEDFWHKSKGFSGNIKTAATTLYSKERGRTHQIYFNL